MSLGYTYLNTIPLIGTKSGTTRTSTLATSAFADNLSRITPIGGASTIELSILYTSEKDNNFEVRVETGPDATNMYRLVNESISAGNSTLTLRTFIVTPTTSAFAFALPIDVSNKYIRVSVRENHTLELTSSSAYVEMMILGDK